MTVISHFPNLGCWAHKHGELIPQTERCGIFQEKYVFSVTSLPRYFHNLSRGRKPDFKGPPGMVADDILDGVTYNFIKTEKFGKFGGGLGQGRQRQKQS